MRIIVLGYIVRGPLGGLVWHHLQYVLGLHRLGHDVFFLEDSDDYEACYDPSRDVVAKDPTYGLQFATNAFESVGLGDRWAYFDAHTNRWLGPRSADAVELFRTADLLLNISGVNAVRDWTMRPPHRVLIDTDPVFTQVRHIRDESAMARAAAHNAYFTFAGNAGNTDCTVPDDGFGWAPTRQPVVLDQWPVTRGPAGGNFRTVMQWDSYPAVEFDGRTFGMKSASFPPYFDLPERVEASFELALGSATPPRQLLAENGWVLSDPLVVTRTPASYQEFIRGSKAEFSVAKHGYVVSRSGWFSERSAAYLASGRPVVTQDTGFSDILPTGRGVLAYDSPESAADAIQQVNAEYDSHCRAAREIAEQFFGSDCVLNELIGKVTPIRAAGKVMA